MFMEVLGVPSNEFIEVKKIKKNTKIIFLPKKIKLKLYIDLKK
jgi:hypothetical protein